MPRTARVVIPGLPHHVTQRGNRCQQTFFGPDDYECYLELLRHWCGKAGTQVWAWCLMPNHVHLILVPQRPDGLAAALAPVHRRYTWTVNRREGWHGFFWQGRFGSAPMDEAHLHTCFRYVELNPVRARLVDRAERWRWSSARAHLGLAADALTAVAPGHGSTIGVRCSTPASATASARRSGPANAPDARWAARLSSTACPPRSDAA